MNICMCGSQAGYPHDKHCPYPYFGGDPVLEQEWYDARRMKQIKAESTKPTKVTNKLIRRIAGKLESTS